MADDNLLKPSAGVKGVTTLFEDLERYNQLEAAGHEDAIEFQRLLTKIKEQDVREILTLEKSERKKLLDEENILVAAALQKQGDARIKIIEDAYNKELETYEGLADEKSKAAIAAIEKEHKTKIKKAQAETQYAIKSAKKSLTQKIADEKQAEAKKVKNSTKELLSKNNKNKIQSLKELADNVKYIIEEDEDGNKTYTRRSGKDTAAQIGNVVDSLVASLGSAAKQLEGTVDEIGNRRGSIDTRLQGARLDTKEGSYWESISSDVTEIAAAAPTLIKQSALNEQVSNLVGQGIAFNVEERAVLAVMKDKIATTFDATNGALLRLVRIQQQDTTAGRLGMESALTAFLNNMYETTEYMENVAKSVKTSLTESMSLMSGQDAVSFEYQVQKWLGSMYSVGMSETAVSRISQTLGQLAAGQLEGITSDGTGTLMVMAASEAGLNIADMLKDGLDESSTNKLMTAMVEYLSGIYDSTKDSKVLQQQFANVYGLTASDLKALSNLSTSTQAVSSSSLSYSGALQRLSEMAGTMGKRTSTGEKMSNALDNFKYTLASGIANNSALYGTYKLGALLKDVTGGINIPTIMAMGSGVDLETTVADLMMSGALGASMISGIGLLAGGAKNTINGSGGTSILDRLGTTKGITTVSRGGAQNITMSSGISTSESGSVTVGNSNASDIQNATLAGAKDDANTQLISAQDSSEETTLTTVNSTVKDILTIMNNIYNGANAIRVEANITDFNSNITVKVQQ